MTDTIPHRHRLWRILGLGVAIGLAASPGAALSPRSEPAPEAQLWQVQAESDEGGEAAEAGEAGAIPEGAAGGTLAAEDPIVGILTGLGLVEGHLRSGIEAGNVGDHQTASVHMAHPTAELLEALEPRLEARGLPGLDAEIDALEGAETAADRTVAAEAVLARMQELRDTLAASPAQRFEALAAILRVAALEYAVGVAEGIVSNAEDYQDARGFVAAARAEAEALAESDDPAVAEAAQEALAAIAETDAALPAFAPGEPLPLDASEILFGAVARVELAGLQVR